MRTILILSLFLSSSAFAQKLKVNEADKFTKQKRLQTENTTLKNKLNEGLSVSLRSVDSSLYITLYGYGKGIGVIGDGDKAIFLLDDGSTVTSYSTGIQTYNVSTGTSTYKHQYSISKDDVILLSKKDVKSIRKYMSDGYVDIDIPEKHQDEIRKLAALLINNL